MPLEHHPVLLQEVIEKLKIKSDGIYVDVTFGRGGHSVEIMRSLGPQGKLFAMDRDPDAIARAKNRPEFQDPRFSIMRAPFSRVKEEIEKRGWLHKVDGILMDVGVSSPQLDDPARGFSFMKEGPLDMRMDPDSGQSAADWLNQAEVAEISQVLKYYGEERWHRRIASAIVQARELKPLSTTTELASIVERAAPKHERHKHPATRVFQAIRIFINQELDELKTVLDQALEVLAVGGRICAISFHSLEDRIVKQFIRHHAQGDPFPPHLPIRASDIQHRLKKIGGLIRPGEEEVGSNPRSRSSRMRVAEKLR